MRLCPVHSVWGARGHPLLPVLRGCTNQGPVQSQTLWNASYIKGIVYNDLQSHYAAEAGFGLKPPVQVLCREF